MSRTYVGRRREAMGEVDVYGPDGIAPLDDGWVDPAYGFTWGAGASPGGARALAHALLADIFGVATTDALALIFVSDVILRLPAMGFALDEEEVRRWLEPCHGRRLAASELVEHVGAVALADREQKADLLQRMVERCWDERSLRQ